MVSWSDTRTSARFGGEVESLFSCHILLLLTEEWRLDLNKKTSMFFVCLMFLFVVTYLAHHDGVKSYTLTQRHHSILDPHTGRYALVCLGEGEVLWDRNKDFFMNRDELITGWLSLCRVWKFILPRHWSARCFHSLRHIVFSVHSRNNACWSRPQPSFPSQTTEQPLQTETRCVRSLQTSDSKPCCPKPAVICLISLNLHTRDWGDNTWTTNYFKPIPEK